MDIQTALVTGVAGAFIGAFVVSGGSIQNTFRSENLRLALIFAIAIVGFQLMAPQLLPGFHIGLGARAAGLAIV